MDYQVLFNITIVTLGSLGGFILRAVWANIKDLQSDLKNNSDKLSAIEVLVAGKYVTKDELNKMFDSVFRKLELIELKLDNKVSREDLK